MKQGIEKNEDSIINNLLKEAEVFYDSKIKPKEEKGEIEFDIALSILENLAKAKGLPDNDSEKLNIIESEMNRMNRILEREKNIEENLKYQSYEKITPAESAKNAFEFSQAISLVLESLYEEKAAYKNTIEEITKLRDENIGVGKKSESILNKARFKKTYQAATFVIEDYEKKKKAVLAKISFYEKARAMKNEDIKDEIEEAFKKGIINNSEKSFVIALLGPAAIKKAAPSLQEIETQGNEKEEKEEAGSLEEGKAVPYTFPELKYRLKYKQMEMGEYREDLFSFRLDISDALEDLYGEKQVLDKKINELYEKFDEVLDNNFYDTADELVNLQKERNTLQEKISFYQRLQNSNEPESEIESAFARNIIDESEKESVLQLLLPEKEEPEMFEDRKREELKEFEEEGGEKEKTEEKSLFDRMRKAVKLISERKIEAKQEEREKLLIDLSLFLDIDLERLDEAYFLKLLINQEEYHILRPLASEFLEDRRKELEIQKQEEEYYKQEHEKEKQEQEVRALLRKRDKSEAGYAPQEIARRPKKGIKKGGRRGGQDEKKKEDREKREEEKREQEIIKDLFDHPVVGKVYADIERDYKRGFIPNRYFIDKEVELREIFISDEPCFTAQELFHNQDLTFGEYFWLSDYFKKEKIYEKTKNLLDRAMSVKKRACDLFETLKEKSEFSEDLVEDIENILGDLSEAEYCLAKKEKLENPPIYAGEYSFIKEQEKPKIAGEKRDIFRAKIFADTGLKMKYYLKLNIKKLFSKWSEDYFMKKIERKEFKEKEMFAESLARKIKEDGGFKEIFEIISDAFEKQIINEEEKKLLSSIYS